jgi:hypothetical protein
MGAAAAVNAVLTTKARRMERIGMEWKAEGTVDGISCGDGVHWVRHAQGCP